MKKILISSVFLIAGATVYAAAIEQVIVRQQWPWSTDIKVEYKLSGVTEPVDLTVRAYNGPKELPILPSAISGDRFAISEGGVGQLMIDPVAAFGTNKVALAEFKVKLSVEQAPSNVTEVLYKVINLSEPYDVTHITRADLLNGKYGAYETSFSALNPNFSTLMDPADVIIWTGVTNDVKYKTSHLVLRKIPAARKSFMFQKGIASVNGGAGVKVTFPNDFYIGVFEVTQAQLAKIVTHPNAGEGGGSNETNALYAACRPVNRISFGKQYRTGLRGYTNGLRWPEGDHTSVDAGSFMGKLQSNTGLLCDLPTEAMWEYACRALSPSDELYTGVASSDAQAALIMRAFHINCVNEGLQTPKLFAATAPSNCDLTDGTAQVGSYLPNAWGLYDMLGNMWEFCLDKYGEISGDDLCDPRGPAEYTTANMRVVRGGAYNIARGECLCTTRASLSDVTEYRQCGFRVCVYMDEAESK